jgi:type I restriction enzyme S subunit
MEITPLKKQTEAGVIPEDWDVFRLADNFKIYAGGDVPKHSLSDTRSEIHPYPIFANALQGNGLYGFTNEKRAKADSVTVTARGYVGHAEYRQEPFFPIVRLLVLEPTGHLDAQFTTFAINERVTFALESTGVPQLTAPQIGKYSIAAPCLKEQRNIAQALSDVDDLITALDRLIAKKRDIKQATMQLLLTGKTRLPGFSGKWETKQVASFTNCVAGGTPSTLVRSYWGGSIKWMSSGDLHLKRVKDVTGRITQAGLDNSAATILPRQCVLIGLAGQGKTRGTVAINLTELSTNQSIGAILPNDTFVPDYLFHNLDSRYTELRELSSGGGRGGLNLKILGRLGIPLPSIPEQTAIASVLSDMDAELTALEARRDKTRAIKQGMMQELLTGKTRLI